MEASFTSYKNLFQMGVDGLDKISNYVIAADLPTSISNLNNVNDVLRGQVQTYIAGYISKKLNTNVFKNCRVCLKNLSADIITNEHILITAREYNT